MSKKELQDFIEKKANFIADLTGFGTKLHINDILPDLIEIAEKACELGKNESCPECGKYVGHVRDCSERYKG